MMKRFLIVSADGAWITDGDTIEEMQKEAEEALQDGEKVYVCEVIGEFKLGGATFVRG